MSEKMSMNKKTLHTTVLRYSHDGRGLAKYDDKVVFIQGALPGEEVEFKYIKRRSQYDEAEVVRIFNPSPHRVTPKCEHFGVCGGCALQYLIATQQVQMKEAQVHAQLSQALSVDVVNRKMPAITGSTWQYRRRARLSVKYVAKKAKILVGFRERNGRYVADVESCAILSDPVGRLLTPLARLIQSLTQYDRIPQIEVAVADNAVALVLRHLDDLTPKDEEALLAFSQMHQVQWYLQPKGPDSVHLLSGLDKTPLYYEMFDNTLRLYFQPTDFIQINAQVNERLIQRAIDLLVLSPHDTVLDLFCGLGNISLSVAQMGVKVVAVEGETTLIERARANAIANNLSNIDFYVADLTNEFQIMPWFEQAYTILILDPPRVGAVETIRQLATKSFEKIVYISCNPATLARDAVELINQGYQLINWSVADMFPHTHHVETVVLFHRVS